MTPAQRAALALLVTAVRAADELGMVATAQVFVDRDSEAEAIQLAADVMQRVAQSGQLSTGNAHHRWTCKYGVGTVFEVFVEREQREVA